MSLWNCAIDVDVANEARDCKSETFWNARLTFAGSGRVPTPVAANNMPDVRRVLLLDEGDREG